MKPLPDELPVLPFSDAAAWAAWLADNHDGAGVWLKLAKKASGIPTVTYGEALDEALCWGWIDGQKRSFDELYFLQRFTPRRARSVWSKVNVEKVAQLEAAGRMRPQGRAHVEAAKASGRWDAAYGRQSDNEVPPELAAALDADPTARAAFDALSGANRFAYAWRVQTAVRADTKARRVQACLDALASGTHPH